MYILSTCISVLDYNAHTLLPPYALVGLVAGEAKGGGVTAEFDLFE